LDETDIRILCALERDGRVSVSALAGHIGMSGPSVTERIRRMESAGVIRNFTVDIDITELGYELAAIVRIKPRPGQLHIVEKMIHDELRFTSCDAVTGDDCFVCRLAFRAMRELDGILQPFHERAETNTAIVKSSPVRHRLPMEMF
jgi:Lrp/AsnC family leucine-responsive transcriptional regulator